MNKRYILNIYIFPLLTYHKIVISGGVFFMTVHLKLDPLPKTNPRNIAKYHLSYCNNHNISYCNPCILAIHSPTLESWRALLHRTCTSLSRKLITDEANQSTYNVRLTLSVSFHSSSANAFIWKTSEQHS